MPHFNEFRINEELLGKVLVARRGADLSATNEEYMEVRRFMNELEEKKRTKRKSLKVLILEMLTGKKFVEFKDQNGDKKIREYVLSDGEKPEPRISATIDRDIDFGDDVIAWRNYVHEESIRDGQRWIKKAEQEKNHEILVATIEQVFYKEMMRIN